MSNNGTSNMASEWAEVIFFLEVCKALLLWGPPGTGKTHSAIHAPRPDGTPLYVVTATEETPAAELRGFFVPSGGGEFRFMLGPVLQWWKTGGRLVVDEIGQLSADAMTFMLGALNSGATAQMTLPTGETVRPTPDVWRQVIGTTNANPADMLTPLVERLFPALLIDTPHPDAYMRLPESIREAARNAIGARTGDDTSSFRAWIAFAEIRNSAMGDKGMSLDAATDCAARAIWGHKAQSIVDAIRLIA